MKNTIVIIGGGGREHAIASALKRSDKVGKLYVLPGNAGIAEIAECVAISVMDFKAIIEFCKSVQADLVFVAPDDPLAVGLVNLLNKEGFSAFGPTMESAIIESSKVFAKQFMRRHNIPTARCETFDDYLAALDYIQGSSYPLVVKADGLALGKGVIICRSLDEGRKALKEVMLDKVFKDAGKRVVIEEFLEGKEVSVLAFCDGTHFSLMPSSQDYKKAYDGDEGLNTGGMGAVSPSPFFTDDIRAQTINEIVIPTIRGLKQEGREFKGVIYFGLMLTSDGVKVLEYNARFGDPETQVVLPKLESDFFDIIQACINGDLDKLNIKWEDVATVAVVAASGGYPLNSVKGLEIKIQPTDDTFIFHSGTARKDGLLVTNGGRVLCVCAKGQDISQARIKAYEGLKGVSFEGIRYRSDIALF